MTDTERHLLESLRDLQRAATARAPEARPALLPLFARIDSLAAQLPPDAPADLLHYLRRKSYEKARLWLEGRHHENVPGSCH
jgi:hypothetical protein